MTFLLSVALFAAAVFLFLYAVQLQQREALPKWAQRDAVLHGVALGFTLIAPLSLALMMATAPPSSVAHGMAIAVATAVAIVAAAYYFAAYLAEASGRRKRLRL
jgi:hypothetical protein